jgi:hypothetical protein
MSSNNSLTQASAYFTERKRTNSASEHQTPFQHV